MTTTRHPEELLAEYVDGTLDERDRRVVDAHLASCPTCRDELGLAGGARAVLRDLPEEPVPLGVRGPVSGAASRRGRAEPGRWGQRIQWVAGIAAAAAIVGVVAISLPNVGGGDGSAERAGTLEAAAQATGTPDVPARFAAGVTLEESHRDLGDRTLHGLAVSLADAVRDDSFAPSTAEGATEETRRAVDCVATGARSARGEVLVRLLRARYQGDPAYVAVSLEVPAGQQPSRAIARVVSVDGCQLVDTAEARI